MAGGQSQGGKQEPPPSPPKGTPESDPGRTTLDFPVLGTVPTHPGERRTRCKINLDELVIGVQEELKALVQARRTMTWAQRELTQPMLDGLTIVLVRLQDQREAHRLIERYFDLLATNPAAAQKLPGMSALKRIAGGMANADKAAKGDGRNQSEKGKRKADDLLAGIE